LVVRCAMRLVTVAAAQAIMMLQLANGGSGASAEMIGQMRFDRPRHLGSGYNCDDFKGFPGGYVCGSFEHDNWQGSTSGGTTWQPPLSPNEILPLVKGSVLVNSTTRFSMDVSDKLPKGKGPHYGWMAPSFTAFGPNVGGQYPFSAWTVNRTMSFSGVPQPGLLTVQGAGGSGGAVTLGDGSLLMSVRVMWAGAPGIHNNPNSTRATSIVAFHSSDGYEWRYRGSVMDAASMPQSLEGPSEHDLVLLADNKTVLCITRLDGGDGSRSWILPYGRAVSSDGGRTWSQGTVLPKGVGSARPSLMRTADGQVVLSGGRLSPTDKDVRVWLNSGRGLGLQPWQPHSISYLHNLMEPNKTLHFTPLINCSHTHAESLSYTSIVATGAQSGVVVYAGSFSIQGNNQTCYNQTSGCAKTWAGRPFLPPLAFAMPFTVL